MAWATASAATAQRLPAQLRYEVPSPAEEAGGVGVVYSVLQDRTGYLWLATEDGLYRYDGYHFRAFRADPSDPVALPVQRLLALAEAPDGRLWMLADRFGLVRFDCDTERFERFPLPDYQAPPSRLAVGSDGAPLFTVEGALWRLDPATGTATSVPGAGPVSDLSGGADGHVWASGPQPPRRFDAETQTRTAAALPAGTSVRVTASGVWAAGRERWWRRTASGRFEEKGRIPAPFQSERSVWTVDRRGVLWQADGTGLTACAPGGCRAYPDGLPDRRVQAIYEDRGGVLWIATLDGLRLLVPRWDAFTAYDLPEPDLGVSLGLAPSGDVIAAPFCGRPFRLDPATETFQSLAEHLPAAAALPGCITSFARTRSGALWIAGWTNNSDGGVVQIDAAGRTARHVLPWPDLGPRAAPNAVRVVFEDAEGRIWTGGEGGLARFDADAPATDALATADFSAPVQRFGRETGGLPSDIVWHLADARTPAGAPADLWVATYGGGLCRFTPTTGRARCHRHDADDPASIPSDQVSLVVPVPADSAVWVGTFDGGLARLDERTGRFQRVGVRDGLPHPFVRSLVPDRSGRVWVGTFAGLVRVVLGDDGEAPVLDVFTQADGLPSIGFGLYDGLALPDGRFVFGTDRHVIFFHPDSVRAAPFEPPLVLSQFDVLGERRRVGMRPDEIRVRYAENALRFGFTALDFAAPRQTRYAYRMDGFDAPEDSASGAGWTAAGERAATYTNLAPGRYRFRVRARTGSGTWAVQELAIPLVVVPPFWMTNWFRTGSFVLFMLGVGAVGSGLARRRYRDRMRELEGERQVQAERVRISRDLHDHVGAQLAGLLGEIDLVRLASRRAAQTGASAADVGPHLDRLEADARTTMGQLRETIWALHHEALTLGEFTDRLRRYSDAQVGAHLGAPAVTVALLGDPEAVLRPAVALHLYRIGQEAIRNAIRHAGAGQVQVELHQHGGRVVLTVHDDGAFREPPGGDGAGGNGSDLTGFGLQTMRERAREIGATFRLDTAAGTRIEVVVPDV